jgi:hypothetical protein
MKKTVIEKKLSVESIVSFIHTRGRVNQGLAVFAYSENPEARNEFIGKLIEHIENDDTDSRLFIGQLDVSVRFSDKTIYSRLFPRNSRGQMEDYSRKEAIKGLRDITIIKNPQDLLINTKKELQTDMALIRTITSRDHGKVIMFIGPKSIIKIMELDSDLSALSLSGEIEN